MTLVGPSIAGHIHEVGADETSMNIGTWSRSFKSEFDDPLLKKNGERRGAAIGATMNTISVSGEVSAASGGVMDLLFTTASTLANLTADNTAYTALFGLSESGIALLKEATITNDRTAWKSITMSFEIYGGITAAS